MNPLILHLKYKYYNNVKNGCKRVEYREYKPYWISRIKNQKELIIVPGYSLDNCWDLKAVIIGIRLISFSKLPQYAKDEFKGSKYNKFFEIKFHLEKVN